MNPFDEKTSRAIAVLYIGNCLLIGWIGAMFGGAAGFLLGCMTGGAATRYVIQKMFTG